ncbi:MULTISPECIES: Eco29kI family restriction endonuclease [unclassified Corallococcus]|uniref:Eco29kI family restriction endonuclease n=1 Tax=unclassified Corallococcus TaxID=2685029 RepID=UPI001A8EC086|nr:MULTISPECIES: Eco29kI family restriction endonuclease [unclassified Corallococcus]MBN9680925.1 Eco29kI family restriction endonuclease [Corallococcus sp. NCSPR001]WAS87477.1 Eco29kI family restriction endonuclease [Corallococcus sp. NCRR]
MSTDEYNPLDYANLTKNCVDELMTRGPYTLDLDIPFEGAGVYALFYKGKLDIYAPVSSKKAQWPIYVGKAVPAGARKGAKETGASRSLYSRLRQHRESIRAADNLDPKDFLARYLVVTPLWITMAERFLIEHYQPVWNVCIEGFGNHDPGSGRHQGERSWWDTLHPGRGWAEKLVASRKRGDAKQRLSEFLKDHRPGAKMPALRSDPDLFTEDDEQ